MKTTERRTYERYNFSKNFRGSLSTKVNDQEVKLQLVDISEAGIGAVLEESMSNIIKKDTSFTGAELFINEVSQCLLNLSVETIREFDTDNKSFFARASDEESSSALWEVLFKHHSPYSIDEEKHDKITEISERIPGRGLYTEEARLERLEFIRDFTNAKLENVAKNSFEPQKLSGNIEGFIGSVEIPVGIAGPLKINGQEARGVFFAPMATTEGALVASVVRGATAISRSGGATARVLGQRMMRVPFFVLADLKSALFFSAWIREHFYEITEQTKKYSNYAELIELYPQLIGKTVHVHFVYRTGDASGQNMTTTCTWNACMWILKKMEYFKSVNIEKFLIEGNLSNDKKVTFQSFIKGRGIRVISEVFIPEKVLNSVLKVTSSQLASSYLAGVSGAIEAGMIGTNINIANVIAAIFTSTGQDIACVHESSIGHFHIEATKEGIYASMMLPSLVIGSIGGGTSLTQQRECLEIMDCYGLGKNRKLAEIIASFCLALDLSTNSAVVGGQFAGAHERLGRNRPVNHMKRGDFNIDLITKIMQQTLEDDSIQVQEFNPIKEKSSGTSIITQQTSGKINKLLGIFPYKLVYSNRDSTINTDVMVKIKPKDTEVIHTLNAIGSICDQRLAEELKKANGKMAFTNCHVKELEIYRQKDERFTKYIPKIYGIYENEDREAYVIMMERLQNLVLMDSADDISGWTKNHIYTAIDGISELHSIWYGKEDELKKKSWIGHYPTTNRMMELSRLFELLGVHLQSEFPNWISDFHLTRYRDRIKKIPEWWGAIENMPKTLIHNDFNPRNIAFRKTNTGLQLCVYDWELATVHLPQHDVCELLAFVLDHEPDREELVHYAEYQRKALEKACGISINVDDWWQGYRSCIWDLMVNRIVMYVLAHTVRDYKFMLRILNRLRQMIEIIVIG
ncbi:Hydroxymethylglutaryl-CoA reductase (NADPH) [Candidatus Magnetomorum sp. HK-1]|nr:Hydroxymethylglutaryl-CoA reductase (NADPH) [Candidatus Magnetomorum sp. HK-1]